MPPKKPPIVRTGPIAKLDDETGVVHIIEPRWRYRVLFNDGEWIDVESYHDNSDTRRALLELRAVDTRIVGVSDRVLINPDGWHQAWPT